MFCDAEKNAATLSGGSGSTYDWVMKATLMLMHVYISLTMFRANDNQVLPVMVSQRKSLKKITKKIVVISPVSLGKLRHAKRYEKI